MPSPPPPPPPNGNVISGPGSVTNYSSDQTYHYDRGLVVLPQAGVTSATKVIRLHGGYGLRTVNWSAGRKGKPPVVPSLTDAGRDKMLGGDVQVRLPAPTGDGPGFVWEVNGSYQFVQYAPRIVGTTTLPAGRYPYQLSPTDDVAQALAGPGIAAVANLDPAVDDIVDVFAKAVAGTTEVQGEVNHATENYVWPFTYLPPIFTNDYLIEG